MSIGGKDRELMLGIYRTLKGEARPLNPWRVYRILERHNGPYPNMVGRAMRKLHEKGYLRIDHSEVRASGQRVNYYVPTVRFDRAVRLTEPRAGSVKIPKAVADEAKEFLKTKEAKEMQLYTLDDVADAALRDLLRRKGYLQT